MKSMGRMIPHILRMFTKKTDTVQYPYVHAQVADRFRGMLKFNAERCVGCKLCVRVCPADAIRIEAVGEKQYKATVHLEKCIFCGQCVDSCNKGALENTASFELASGDKDSLEVEI